MYNSSKPNNNIVAKKNYVCTYVFFYEKSNIEMEKKMFFSYYTSLPVYNLKSKRQY